MGGVLSVHFGRAGRAHNGNPDFVTGSGPATHWGLPFISCRVFSIENVERTASFSKLARAVRGP